MCAARRRLRRGCKTACLLLSSGGRRRARPRTVAEGLIGLSLPCSPEAVPRRSATAVASRRQLLRRRARGRARRRAPAAAASVLAAPSAAAAERRHELHSLLLAPCLLPVAMAASAIRAVVFTRSREGGRDLDGRGGGPGGSTELRRAAEADDVQGWTVFHPWVPERRWIEQRVFRIER